jgi:hypothetical protein
LFGVGAGDENGAGAFDLKVGMTGCRMMKVVMWVYRIREEW